MIHLFMAILWINSRNFVIGNTKFACAAGSGGKELISDSCSLFLAHNDMSPYPLTQEMEIDLQHVATQCYSCYSRDTN